MDLFTEKLAVFPVLRATTKAEVEEGKKKLTDGLKVGTLWGTDWGICCDTPLQRPIGMCDTAPCRFLTVKNSLKDIQSPTTDMCIRRCASIWTVSCRSTPPQASRGTFWGQSTALQRR